MRVRSTLAVPTDVATGRWVPKSLKYLTGSAFPWRLVLFALLTAVAGGLAYVVIRRWLAARPPLRHWLRHLIEMLLAMAAGMGALGMVWSALIPGLRAHPAGMTMTMAVDMTIGMSLWMAVRGHDRRMIGEMAVVMVAPFVLLLAPYARGLISGGVLSDLGHGLMLLAMVALMLVRRRHYSAPPTWTRPRIPRLRQMSR
jgi:hypothetical protein